MCKCNRTMFLFSYDWDLPTHVHSLGSFLLHKQNPIIVLSYMSTSLAISKIIINIVLQLSSTKKKTKLWDIFKPIFACEHLFENIYHIFPFF